MHRGASLLCHNDFSTESTERLHIADQLSSNRGRFMSIIPSRLTAGLHASTKLYARLLNEDFLIYQDHSTNADIYSPSRQCSVNMAHLGAHDPSVDRQSMLHVRLASRPEVV
jgi:hypothetical protein